MPLDFAEIHIFVIYRYYTGMGARMSYRKWRENKQHLIWWPELVPLWCCLVSLYFWCDILAPIPVYADNSRLFWMQVWSALWRTRARFCPGVIHPPSLAPVTHLLRPSVSRRETIARWNGQRECPNYGCCKLWQGGKYQKREEGNFKVVVTQELRNNKTVASLMLVGIS